ncbi:hypothetical protein L1887_37932 [Cichorium endivia]|nr:hypothetical protein L1887_37932 [Cichorium endivia]
MEKEALDHMCKLLGGGPPAEEIYELWTEYEENSTNEVKVVKDFDKMTLQALEYEKEQGKDLQEFFQSTAGSKETFGNHDDLATSVEYSNGIAPVDVISLLIDDAHTVVTGSIATCSPTPSCCEMRSSENGRLKSRSSHGVPIFLCKEHKIAPYIYGGEIDQLRESGIGVACGTVGRRLKRLPSVARRRVADVFVDGLDAMCSDGKLRGAPDVRRRSAGGSRKDSGGGDQMHNERRTKVDFFL